LGNNERGKGRRENRVRRALSLNEVTELEKIALSTALLPFYQRLMALMDYLNWNPQRFTKYTHLDGANYSKLKGGQREKLDMRTAVAIFVGLRLPLHIAESLLQSAGMAFSNSKADRTYRYVIMMMNGADINECNEYLQQEGVPLLGSISKGERVSA
jgi:hypothetical protein